jgi:predicted ester cyclase
MSVEENKVIVRRFYEEVMNNGEVELLDEIMDEDFDDRGEALFGSPQGREVIRQGIIATRSILPDLHVSIQEMIAEDDMVGVRGIMRCTHQGEWLGVTPTGNELTWKGIAMFRLAEGKLMQRWFNSDGLSIVQQLGLVPPLVKSAW